MERGRGHDTPSSLRDGNGGQERSVTFFSGIADGKLLMPPANTLPSMLMKATLIKCSGSHTKKRHTSWRGTCWEEEVQSENGERWKIVKGEND